MNIGRFIEIYFVVDLLLVRETRYGKPFGYKLLICTWYNLFLSYPLPTVRLACTFTHNSYT
jgi:hypothetical protein